MTKSDQVKNILAFLGIMFAENTEVYKEIMRKSPSYLIKKFERYILSQRDEHEWGLHPSLRRTYFNSYCRKWAEELQEEKLKNE